MSVLPDPQLDGQSDAHPQEAKQVAVTSQGSWQPEATHPSNLSLANTALSQEDALSQQAAAAVAGEHSSQMGRSLALSRGAIA